MQRYVISAWTRDDDGNVPMLFLDAQQHRWSVVIEDVTDQAAGEIRIDHQVLTLVTVWDENQVDDVFAEIDALGYTSFPVEGELTAEERTKLAAHADDIGRLPPQSTRATAKQLLVERFKQQGPRDDIKDAVREITRSEREAARGGRVG